MLISVAIKLLLIFIIPILASSVPLELGYISTGSQLSHPELDIAVQAIKKVEELKILPGISLSFKVIVGEPLLHNVSTSFVALFGASSNLKYVKVVTNEWTKPIIIHGFSNKEIVKDPSVLNASPSSAQFAESLLTILQFRQVKSFSIVMEASENWKEIASKMESLASFKQININRIKPIPGFDPLSEPSNSDEVWQNIIADTHCDTKVYVFLGKFINLIQFTTAMQKMDLLKSHYILAANLEANCFESGSSYLFGSTPGTMGAVEIVAPSCVVSSTFSSIKSKNLTLTPSLLLKQPLRSVFVPHLYDGILLYARALRFVLQQYFVKGNQDPVQLAANASSIFDAIAFLQNCKVVPHFNEATACENSLTVAVPTPDNMFENGHSQRYIYQVVSIEQLRHSGASLVFNETSISENYLASRDKLCRFSVNHSFSPRWSVGDWFVSLAILFFVSLSTLLLMIGPPIWMRRRMPHSQSVQASGKFSFDPITRKSKKKFKFNDVLESIFCLPKLDNMVDLTVPLEFNILRNHIPNRHYRRLSEILSDPSVEIDQVLQNSLIQDLLFALIQLEILGLCHGNLKSSNCLITSKWQLEVTRSELPVESDLDYYTNLLWKAPELLRDPSAVPTIQSDVYAFGILVHELVHRRGPFGVRQDGHDPSEEKIQTIIYKVKEGPTSYESKPVRPTNDRGPDYLEECWHEHPAKRPDFLSLNDSHNETEDVNSDGDIEHPNVVDFMIDEVDVVTSGVINSDPECRNLAQSVCTREKQLYDVLPKYAAESIMQNLRVEPREFPCVVILFGHIMNLEELSVNRSPEELYHLLRGVSNGFTSIARKYSVLRLEAVNEDYLVASWPEMVGDAGRTLFEEIAVMALELKSHFQNYQISLNSGSTLRLSIGIHTGPAAGGVIGLFRPHYHLFGKVVNVASRLSTSGEPGRIHISCEFKQMLEQSVKFETVLRGTIPLKGVGEMCTYWLEEREFTTR